jgi:hypothetical protein
LRPAGVASPRGRRAGPTAPPPKPLDLRRYHAYPGTRNILSNRLRGAIIFPLDLLRRRKSDSPAEFGAFLGRQAVFVAQKTVIDYCRVKAGRQEKRLFDDADFQQALRHCRWQVWLAALADVCLMAEAWLRPQLPGRTEALARAVVALHAAALAAETPPPEEAEDAAQSLRAFPGQLAARLLAEPASAHRMKLLAEAPLFATLPIHPDQRLGEAPAIRGALRFHIVSTQQEMERRFDPAGLAARLVAPG